MSFATTIHRRGHERALAVISAVALLLSFMAVFAQPAWAHQGTVAWGCDGWSINLSAYFNGADITVTVDGQVVDTDTNWTSYSNSGSWDDSQSHTLQVVVDAYDDGNQPVYNNLGSNSSFSPAWQQGEWSFTLNITQDACTQPPQDVATTVASGSCSVGPNSQPAGSIDVTIDPDQAATVNLYSDAGMNNLVASLTSSGTVDDVAPGTYYWEAIPETGYQLTGPSTGSVTVDDCEVTVTVGGTCQVPNDVAVGEINVTISVDNAATVEVSDSNAVIETFTQSGSVSVPVGASYTWSATAASGFDLVGDDSGSVDIDDCTPPDESGEIIVEKVVQGEGSQVFEFTFNTTNFTLGDNTLAHGQSSSSGAVAVGDGYAVSEVVPTGWSLVSAVCDDGSDPSNIDVSADEVVTCTFTNEIDPPEVGAAILVTVAGTCQTDGDDGEGVISVTVSVAGGATVVVTDSDGDIVGTLSQDGSVTVPEGAVYNWSATASDGFEFPVGFDSSGSVTIGTCSTPEVLPFTGIESDGLFKLGFVLLAAGLVVVTGNSFLFGWREEA